MDTLWVLFVIDLLVLIGLFFFISGKLYHKKTDFVPSSSPFPLHYKGEMGDSGDGGVSKKPHQEISWLQKKWDSFYCFCFLAALFAVLFCIWLSEKDKKNFFNNPYSNFD